MLLLPAAGESDNGECRAFGNRHFRMLTDLVVAMGPTDLGTSVRAGLGPLDRCSGSTFAYPIQQDPCFRAIVASNHGAV
ncbi:Uncharacterised protein [Mycobacteroides abscessus subsp. abscessus]|nr:Uncharacterised protein [Mycobacteroides abscessus subsp. abscessus]